MASPQRENGYTAIANELYDALMKWRLSQYESSVLMFLIRKTYGYGKKEDWVSLSQFEQGTGISKRHVAAALSLLIKQNMVLRVYRGRVPILSVQKDYEQWKPLPTGTRSHHPVKNTGRKFNWMGGETKGVDIKGVDIKGIKGGVIRGVDTKERLQKKDTAASPQTKKMKKNRMGSYSEDRASDSHEEVVDLETGEVAKPKERAGVLPAYKELVDWAQKRRGFKFISVVKQYKAFKEAKTFGLDPLRDLKPRWIQMEEDPFYKDKGFDWSTVIYSFNRKGK